MSNILPVLDTRSYTEAELQEWKWVSEVKKSIGAATYVANPTDTRYSNGAQRWTIDFLDKEAKIMTVREGKKIVTKEGRIAFKCGGFNIQSRIATMNVAKPREFTVHTNEKTGYTTFQSKEVTRIVINEPTTSITDALNGLAISTTTTTTTTSTSS